MPVRPRHSLIHKLILLDCIVITRDTNGYKWMILYIYVYIYTVSEGNGVMVERDPTAFACASGSVA